MRLVDKIAEALREPVIPARLSALAVHALLDHRPAAVIGDDEPVQVKIEPVLDRGAVDFGDKTADRKSTRLNSSHH